MSERFAKHLALPKLVAAMVVGSALLPAAHAETSLGLGLGRAPDYLGSDDFVSVPLPSFTFEFAGTKITNNNLGVEVDVSSKLGAGEGISFGPIVRYDLGRNDGDKVHDSVVRLTTPIKAAAEVGGFLEVARPLGSSAAGLLGSARISLTQGLRGGHEGTLVETSVGVVKLTGPWTIGGALQANFGSETYENAFFGVSEADAIASGLDTYEAKGGLRDAGFSAFASYAISEHLSVDMVASATKLSSNTAHSPLVRERGADLQPFVGLGVTYVFL